MKPAVLFSVPTRGGFGYRWQWRSADGTARSQKSFVYYYDCLTNAQAKGFEAQIDMARGVSSPGYGAVESNRRAL